LRNISADFTTTLSQHSILLLISNLGGGYLFAIKSSRIVSFGMYLHSAHPKSNAGSLIATAGEVFF